jgi:hypothetical protein
MYLTKRNHWHLSLALTCRVALFLLAALSGAAVSHAFASDITVGSPVNGVQISSPALIRAHNTGCDGVPPSSFGYSIDDAKGIVMGETAYDIDVTHQAIPAGTHTVHFKSWTSRGECPTVNTTFKIAATVEPKAGATVEPKAETVATTSPSIPSNAISSGDLDSSSKWTEAHDGGTPGSSKGSTVYPASTPLYDDARKFFMTYSDQAGERWSNTFIHDTVSTHFVLDVYIFLPNPSEVKNIEMDINQVTSNDETIILSTQCSGEIGQWEYGDSVGSHDHWKSTGIKCNPAEWSANTWHHVQIGEHRDTGGFVTHDYVILDGDYHAFNNATLESAHFLDWGKGDLNTQFQIEGSSSKSGSVTAYIHKLTIYRWH